MTGEKITISESELDNEVSTPQSSMKHEPYPPPPVPSASASQKSSKTTWIGILVVLNFLLTLVLLGTVLYLIRETRTNREPPNKAPVKVDVPTILKDSTPPDRNEAKQLQQDKPQTQPPIEKKSEQPTPESSGKTVVVTGTPPMKVELTVTPSTEQPKAVPPSSNDTND